MDLEEKEREFFFLPYVRQLLIIVLNNNRLHGVNVWVPARAYKPSLAGETSTF